MQKYILGYMFCQAIDVFGKKPYKHSRLVNTPGGVYFVLMTSCTLSLTSLSIGTQIKRCNGHAPTCIRSIQLIYDKLDLR